MFLNIGKLMHRIFAVFMLIAFLLILASCTSAITGGKSTSIYDLSAPTDFTNLRGKTSAQLLVQPPVAIRSLDTDRIMVRTNDESIAYYSDAQWADQLPQLIQARLIEAFENTGRVRAVGRPGQGLLTHYQIISDLRAFGIDTQTGSRAIVNISFQIVDDRNGRVVAQRIMKREKPIVSTGTESAIIALNEILEETLKDTVIWVLNRV